MTEVLDSFALLVFMNKETAARTVQEAFARADQGKGYAHRERNQRWRSLLHSRQTQIQGGCGYLER